MQNSPPNIARARVVTQVGRDITHRGQVLSFKNMRDHRVQLSLEFPPLFAYHDHVESR